MGIGIYIGIDLGMGFRMGWAVYTPSANFSDARNSMYMLLLLGDD